MLELVPCQWKVIQHACPVRSQRADETTVPVHDIGKMRIGRR
jgi:hypothetical protein